MEGKPLTPEAVEAGVNLRRVRKRAKLSQENIGTLLGVSGQQIGKIERGLNRLTVDRAQTICTHLGIPLADFASNGPFEGFAGFAEGGAAPYDVSNPRNDAADTLIRFVHGLGEPSRKQVIALVARVHEGVKNLGAA